MSILATRPEEHLAHRTNIDTRHVPAMIVSTSTKEAENFGYALAQKLFPAEGGWEHNVVTVEYTLAATISPEIVGKR